MTHAKKKPCSRARKREQGRREDLQALVRATLTGEDTTQPNAACELDRLLHWYAKSPKREVWPMVDQAVGAIDPRRILPERLIVLHGMVMQIVAPHLTEGQPMSVRHRDKFAK